MDEQSESNTVHFLVGRCASTGVWSCPTLGCSCPHRSTPPILDVGGRGRWTHCCNGLGMCPPPTPCTRSFAIALFGDHQRRKQSMADSDGSWPSSHRDHVLRGRASQPHRQRRINPWLLAIWANRRCRPGPVLRFSCANLNMNSFRNSLIYSYSTTLLE